MSLKIVININRLTKIIMLCQVILFFLGVLYLFLGKIFIGTSIMALTAISFTINLHSLISNKNKKDQIK